MKISKKIKILCFIVLNVMILTFEIFVIKKYIFNNDFSLHSNSYKIATRKMESQKNDIQHVNLNELIKKEDGERQIVIEARINEEEFDKIKKQNMYVKSKPEKQEAKVVYQAKGITIKESK